MLERSRSGDGPCRGSVGCVAGAIGSLTLHVINKDPDEARREVTSCDASAKLTEPTRVRRAAKGCVLDDTATRR